MTSFPCRDISKNALLSFQTFLYWTVLGFCHAFVFFFGSYILMGEDTTLMGNGQVCLCIIILEWCYHNSYKSCCQYEHMRNARQCVRVCARVIRVRYDGMLLIGLVAFLSILSFFRFCSLISLFLILSVCLIIF